MTDERDLILAAECERGRCWQRARRIDNLLWRLNAGKATISELAAELGDVVTMEARS